MLQHSPEQIARDLLGRPVVEACGKRGADTRTPRLRRGVSGHDSCDAPAVFLARGRLDFFAPPPRARLAFVAASPVVSVGAAASAAAGFLAALPRPRLPCFRAAGAGGPPLGLAACSTRAGAGAAAVSTTPKARRSGGGDAK